MMLQIGKTCWINTKNIVYADTKFSNTHFAIKLTDGSIFYVEEEFAIKVKLELCLDGVKIIPKERS